MLEVVKKLNKKWEKTVFIKKKHNSFFYNFTYKFRVLLQRYDTLRKKKQFDTGCSKKYIYVENWIRWFLLQTIAGNTLMLCGLWYVYSHGLPDGNIHVESTLNPRGLRGLRGWGLINVDSTLIQRGYFE